MPRSRGQLLATPNALDALAGRGAQPAPLLDRHVGGDWGELPPGDARANDAGAQGGCAVFPFRVNFTRHGSPQRARPWAALGEPSPRIPSEYTD